MYWRCGNPQTAVTVAFFWEGKEIKETAMNWLD